MIEFGKNLFSQNKDLLTSQNDKKTADRVTTSLKEQMVDLYFEQDTNQKTFHIKQQDFTYENKTKIKEEILGRLEAYYSQKDNGNSSLEYS